MSIIHEPEPGNALVSLAPVFGSIPTTPKSYDSILKGVIVAVHPDDHKDYLIGRTGHWARFKDDVRFEDNYAFVPLQDILGTSFNNEGTNATDSTDTN